MRVMRFCRFFFLESRMNGFKLTDPVHLPEKHLPEWRFPRKTLGRMDISPNVLFPERTLARMYI